MSLLKQIEALRNRPEAERKKAALRLSIALTSVIALLWLVLVFVKSAQNNLVSNQNTTASSTPGISQIFSSFYDSLSNIFKSGSTEIEKLVPPQEDTAETSTIDGEENANNGQESTYFDQSGVESTQ